MSSASSEFRMDLHHLTTPIPEAAIRALKLGDLVQLSGDIVITAGLPTHERLIECMSGSRELPFDIAHGAFFHLGSYNSETDGGLEVQYMNPTTSTRFNDVMPRLIRHFGFRLVGGKGGLDRRSVEAMAEIGCAYLSFLGGGSPLHSRAIVDVAGVGWNDLVSHYRLLKLRVEDLGPLTVAIDANGNSQYELLRESAQSRLPDILAELGKERLTKGSWG
jgi:fumarate hydratase subunit beta